ncbi:unnamed protein product [Rodentolepis nana]|uniref:Metalloendopeptidase n=1 Tax=Rodentolepis nana TaxID=102285 RepID=A0A0R3TJF4_RODNA|nr:unnamed protein product [Rodentolepis nana]
MIKRRRKEVPMRDMLTPNQTTRHHNNPWLHSHCNSLTKSTTFTDNQDLHQLPTWLRPSSRPLPTLRSRTRINQPVSGGQLVLLFFLVLLCQAYVSSAEEDRNDAASSVNTHQRQQQFLLLKARRSPNQHLTGLLQSEKTIPHNLRLTDGGTLYPFRSSFSQDYDSMDLSSHSSRNQGAGATRMKRLQTNIWNDDSQLSLPLRHVKQFIDSLSPSFKEDITPYQANSLTLLLSQCIEYIVREWHSFRKTRRQNHRKQRKNAALKKEEALQRRLNRRQARNRADRFNMVVLGREARALQRASSFDEFKRILLRSSLKSLDTPRILNESILDASILPEVSGGVVFHSQHPHPKDKKVPSITNKNRTLSKRSLDSNDENLFGEQEVDNYSEEELRFAYESYNEFLTNACKPVNKTLCTKTFFPNMHKSKSTLFLPPGLYVQRCDNPIWSSVYGFGSSLNSYQVMFDQASRMRSKSALKALCDAADRMNPNVDTRSHYAADAGGSCTCGLPEEECLPTEVRLKTAPVVVYNTAEGTTTTEVIALTEHMACQCKRRLPTPLNGSYIMPPCYHGQMDEVHLYFRHCPRADGRIGEF